MIHRRLAAVTLLAGLLPLAEPLLAAPGQPAPFPLAVVVSPRPGCPSQVEIEGALRARDLPFRAPAPGEPATELRLSLQPSPDHALGVLEVRLLTGETTRRELQGATCQEVARSLVLVAVLALAPLHAPPPPPPASSSPPPARSSTPTTEQGPRFEAKAAPGPSRWSVGVEVGAMSALGPRVAPGVGLWGQRRLGPVALRLGAGTWPHGGASAGPFRAKFTASLLDLSGCLPWALSPEIEAAPCAGVHGGILEAQGQQIDQPRTERRLWLAPRLGGRLAWAPQTGGLVELNLGAFTPLFRDSFLFEEPRVEIHRPPALGFWGTLGGGFSFK